jgi:hypothetical protein
MRKRISELGEEQQKKIRDASREYKRKQRADEKLARTPTHDDWTWNWGERFPAQYTELRAHEKQFSAKVAEELGRELSSLEEETLSWASITSYCLKKDSSPWVREVSDPKGIIYGGLFYADVLGDDLVRNTHRFELEKSPSYANLYRDLLAALDKKFGENSHGYDPSEAESARDIKAELAGAYQVRIVP